MTLPKAPTSASGPGIAVTEMAKRLSELGHRVSLLTSTSAGGGVTIPDSPFASVEVVRTRSRIAHQIAVAYASRALSNLRAVPDVIHIHEHWNAIAEAAARFGERRRIATFFQPHGGLAGYRAFPWLLYRIPYLTYDFVSRLGPLRRYPTIIATSLLEKEDALHWGVTPSRVAVVPLGISSSVAADHLLPEGRDRPYSFLFVGNIGYFRKVDVVADAAQILSRRGFDFRVRIVGRLQDQSIFARRTKSMDRALSHPLVEFLGPRRRSELATIFASSHAFVYPSIHENFGLPILEAAASGLPVISSRVGVTPEVVEDRGNGRIVDSLDPVAWADAMQDVMDNSLAYRRAAAAAASEIKERFSWERIADQLVSTYNAGSTRSNRIEVGG